MILIEASLPFGHSTNSIYPLTSEELLAIVGGVQMSALDTETNYNSDSGTSTQSTRN